MAWASHVNCFRRVVTYVKRPQILVYRSHILKNLECFYSNHFLKLSLRLISLLTNDYEIFKLHREGRSLSFLVVLSNDLHDEFEGWK